MATRTVSVALVADVGQYQSAMVRAAATTRTVGDTGAAAGGKLQSAFSAASRGAGLLAGVAAGGLVLGLKSAVNAAADAEQSIGGVEAVFKGYANSVIASSKTADRALGLSANSYRELATIIGSQMKNAGVPLSELADKTEDIIGIGADLAAQFGGSTQEAVNALSSAFRGEMDPIERYGISLTAAAVGAKAVEMGLADSATGISQNAKAMATLAIITEQSADAQGAFGREADTASGRAQRAAAQWDNLKVAVGDRLLPAWSALVDVLGTQVIPALGDVLDTGGQVVGFMEDHKEVALALAAVLGVQLAGGVGALTVAFNRMVLTPVVLGLSNLLGAAGSLPAAFATARAAVTGFVASVAPLAAVAGIVYGIAKTVEIAHAAGNARKEIAGMWDAVDDSRGGAQVEALNGLVEQLQSKVSELRHNLEDDGAWETTILGAWLTGAAADKKALEEYEVALRRATGQQKTAQTTAETLAKTYGTSTGQVFALAEKYDIDLSKGLDSVEGKFRSSAEAAEVAGDGMVHVGDTAGMTQDQIDEAAKAVEEWIGELQKIGSAFVEPLSIYQGLLSEKTEAERKAAEATAASTESTADSWEDYVGDVSVSLDELATRLEEQILAQENWRTNIIKITQRGGLEVGQAIAAMGEEGVDLAAKMANGTDEEFRRMAELLIRDARLGGSGAAAELDQQMKVMAAVGAAGANATVQGIATQLGIGAEEVRRISAQYGLNLAEGIDPLLTALGKPGTVGRMASAQALARQRGFAGGGWTGPGGKYEPAGIVHRGEYVLTKEQTSRLGIRRIEDFANNGYATGGFVTSADVPRPYSTAPYRTPISTAGDATMQTGYDAVTSYLGSAFVGPVAGSGVQRWLPVVLRALLMLGQPASLAQTVLRRMQQESGGNPMAINNWDINAQRGTPSKGLMQTIDPTFRAYALPGFNSNVYDPLSNILASMRYAMARYGSLAAAYNKAGGYANGGTTPAGSPFWVGEQGPELMWSSRQQYVTSTAKSREFSGSGGSRAPVIDYKRLGAELAAAVSRPNLTVQTTSDTPQAFVRAFEAHQQQQAALAPAW